MFTRASLELPHWAFIPFALLLFVLPSISVTVESGATSVFLLLLIPSMIFGWKGWGVLFYEEKLLLIGYIVFVISISFSFINCHDLAASLSSFEKYLRFFGFIPIYLFTRRYKLELGPWLSLGCVVGCFIFGIVATYEFYVLDTLRPDGVRNAARFGLVAVILLLLLIWLMVVLWREKIIFVMGIAALLIIYAITLNQTRSAILCIVPFVFLVFYYFREFLNMKKFLISLLMLFSLLLLFLNISPIVEIRFIDLYVEAEAFFKDPVGNYLSSFGLRPHMFHAGMQVFLQSPLFGTGLGDYSYDVQLLMDQGKTLIKDDWLLTSPHNIYINLLAETGLIGFAGFVIAVCIMPVYIFINIVRRNKNGNSDVIRFYAYSGITCIMCYLFFGMFHTWINVNNSISIFLLFQLVYLSNVSVRDNSMHQR